MAKLFLELAEVTAIAGTAYFCMSMGWGIHEAFPTVFQDQVILSKTSWEHEDFNIFQPPQVAMQKLKQFFKGCRQSFMLLRGQVITIAVRVRCDVQKTSQNGSEILFPKFKVKNTTENICNKQFKTCVIYMKANIEPSTNYGNGRWSSFASSSRSFATGRKWFSCLLDPFLGNWMRGFAGYHLLYESNCGWIPNSLPHDLLKRAGFLCARKVLLGLAGLEGVDLHQCLQRANDSDCFLVFAIFVFAELWNEAYGPTIVYPLTQALVLRR